MSHQDRGRNRKVRPAVVKDVANNSKVVQAFVQYAAALDAKHDRYERILKISRDVTIESKRIIFLLHSSDRADKKEAVLLEADKRLGQLLAGHFKNIAAELAGHDAYEYLRAYTAGLQEFVEASTFLHYLRHKTLQGWRDIERHLVYTVRQPTEVNSTDDSKCLEDAAGTQMSTMLPPNDYILGVGDLTGELMRQCINNLGSGDIDGCRDTCCFVREIYRGFLSVGSEAGGKEGRRKLVTLKQSLAKMEAACYTIRVRGGEGAGLAIDEVLSGAAGAGPDEDEGFY